MTGGFVSFVDPALPLQWLQRIDTHIKIGPGQRADDPIEVPERDAAGILRTIVRFVADLPKPRPGQRQLDVVWTLGDSELLVRADEIDLICTKGLITIELTVDCEQIPAATKVRVPFGVGTSTERRGLVMSTYSELEAPTAIAAIWTESITAFAWECIIELASRIAAEVGDDQQGRALVAGAIGAAPNRLLIDVVGRQTLVGALR